MERWVLHRKLPDHGQKYSIVSVQGTQDVTCFHSPKSWSLELSSDLSCSLQNQDQNPSWHFVALNFPTLCCANCYCNVCSENTEGIYHHLSLGVTIYYISFLGIYNAHHSLKASRTPAETKAVNRYLLIPPRISVVLAQAEHRHGGASCWYVFINRWTLDIVCGGWNISLMS